MAAIAPPIRCVAFGLRVSTDIVLPGAMRDDSPSPPDVVIRRVAPRADELQGSTTLWREQDVLHFAPTGVAHYRCAPPGSVDVAPCPGSDDDEIAALLIATALPGLLWLRGGFMLHAAAAILPGHRGAVAMVAASGGGKSTILAELIARGARVVADDSVHLRETATGVLASGLPGGYFAHATDPAARPFVAVAADQGVAAAPLTLMLLLARHDPGRPPSFDRLQPLEALSVVLSHRHRPAISTLFGEPRQRLAAAARIARVPAYRWSRPCGSVALTTAEWGMITRLSGEHDDG